MAVELPPPLPPQALAVTELRGIASQQVISYREYRVHLPPRSPLDADAVRDAIAGATSVDELVSALSQAYYADGELSTQLLYAVDGDEVYLALYPRPITALDAPPRLRPYFESLLGASALSDRDFEPRRALANVQADRAGIAAQARLEPVDGGAALKIEADPRELPTSSLRAEYGNPGNRFVGRHFLDLDLRHSDRSGDQFKLLWHTGLTGIGDGRADDYNEETLTASRVTTAGVWGITGHAFDYNGSGERDGQLREAQLTWLMPVAATLRSRVLLDARVDYINRELAASDLHQREEYPSVQFGAHYSYSASPATGPVDLDLGSSFRKGLRSTTAITGAELDYFLWRPTLSVNAALGSMWSAGLFAVGQLSGDRLPLESQWVLGGVDNLAAWRPGVAYGDTGAYATVDLQYRGWDPYGLRLSPRVFAEYGLSRHESQSDSASQGTAMLADVGVALDAAWRFLEASLAIATPTGHHGVPAAVRHDSEANLLFKLSAQF